MKLARAAVASLWPLAPLLALLLGGCSSASDAADDGKRIYREGLLPSGEPLTAIVAGDVPVLGTQFSCVSCHGRSGMGVTESSFVVPPIASQFLFVPSPQPVRPAYDERSLARALRDGVTPGGRSLNSLMPRFRLEDGDVAALAAYLRGLSAGDSPGVDDGRLHFATVIAADTDPAERKAVLAVLRQYFDEKNRQTRAESGRWDRGFTPESKLPTLFREWVLEEWTVAGPVERWDEQLEAAYAATPVFAIVGSIGTDSWEPVGRFCERRELPCLLPTTEWPGAEAGDFYTLHFSRGLALEADLIAAHLRRAPVTRAVQVACDRVGSLAAATLAAALAPQGVAERRVSFDCTSPLPVADLREAVSGATDAAVVLWLRPEQLGALPSDLLPARLYVSSTLLEREPAAALAGVHGSAYMAHPFRLPGDSDPAMLRFSVWAKTRGIELLAPRAQAEAFFACLAANDAIIHMGRFFVRDYLLDMLDHTQALVAYLPFYPRPTLGPGQRFLNKGGYMLPLEDGRPQAETAIWIAP